MIKDRLKNAKTYYSLSTGIEKGLKWLEDSNLKDLNVGRYYIDGENLYANVDEYETKEEAMQDYLYLANELKKDKLKIVADKLEQLSEVAYEISNKEK